MKAGGESELVLLVDDDPAITEGLAAGLEREGRTIITCRDIESAQLIVERTRPSHVVADIRLGRSGSKGSISSGTQHASSGSPISNSPASDDRWKPQRGCPRPP